MTRSQTTLRPTTVQRKETGMTTIDTTTPSTLDRRGFVRLLSGSALALAAVVTLRPGDAHAGIGWCRADPLVTVNGRTGHVYVESTEQMLVSAFGPVRIEIQVPVGATRSAVPLDHGFNFGYDITFVENGKLFARNNFSEVRVVATAPALDGTLPVRVIFHADSPDLNDSIKTGYANQAITTGVVRI